MLLKQSGQLRWGKQHFAGKIVDVPPTPQIILQQLRRAKDFWSRRGSGGISVQRRAGRSGRWSSYSVENGSYDCQAGEVVTATYAQHGELLERRRYCPDRVEPDVQLPESSVPVVSALQ